MTNKETLNLEPWIIKSCSLNSTAIYRHVKSCSVNLTLLKGGLPLSCRRAVVTLLPKKGDLTEIKNWRPVSLLCSDYKLLSKTLAIRLAKVMGEVIHPDKSYCVPSRHIFDNIYFIRDIIQVSKLLDSYFIGSHRAYCIYLKKKA